MSEPASRKGSTGKCGTCGSALPADSRFCPSCGQEQDGLKIPSADEVFGSAAEAKPLVPKLSKGALVAALAVVALLACAIGWGVAQLGRGDRRQPSAVTSVSQAQPAGSQPARAPSSAFGVPVAGVPTGTAPAAGGPPVTAPPPAMQGGVRPQVTPPTSPRERTGRQLATQSNTSTGGTAAPDGATPGSDGAQSPWGEQQGGRSSSGRTGTAPDWSPPVTVRPRNDGMSLTPHVPKAPGEQPATPGR